MHGVPAIATSLAEARRRADFVFAAEEVLGVARRVKQYGLPPNTFLNVNIPADAAGRIQGYRITTQAMQQQRRRAIRRDDASRRAARSTGMSTRKARRLREGTDIWAVNEGYVSVTPMKLGEIDASQLETLRAIFK